MMNRVYSILASLLISMTVLSDAFFLSTSEADYESLIQRHLQQENIYYDDDSNNEYFEYDLNDFSLKCTCTT
jgi:hypothetical protein